MGRRAAGAVRTTAGWRLAVKPLLPPLDESCSRPMNTTTLQTMFPWMSQFRSKFYTKKLNDFLLSVDLFFPSSIKLTIGSDFPPEWEFYVLFSGTIYFIQGRKYPNVVFEGFEYKIRKTSPTRNYFRCKRDAKGCRAKLETFGKCVLIKDRHNHAPTYLGRVQRLRSVQVVTLRSKVS